MNFKSTSTSILLALLLYHFQISSCDVFDKDDGVARDGSNDAASVNKPTDDEVTDHAKIKNQLVEKSTRKINELLTNETAKKTIDYTTGKLKELFTNHMSSASIISITGGIKDILLNGNSQIQILDTLKQCSTELRKPNTANYITEHYSKLKGFLEDENAENEIGQFFDSIANIVNKPGVDDILTSVGNALITLVSQKDAPIRIRRMFQDLDVLMRSNPDEVLSNMVRNTGSKIGHKVGRLFRFGKSKRRSSDSLPDSYDSESVRR